MGLLCTGAWAIVENLEEGVECGGDNFGCTSGFGGGDPCSGVGAMGRIGPACVLSYRLLGAGVGVGGGPRSSPRSLRASASFAVCSKSSLPLSTRRRYWFLIIVCVLVPIWFAIAIQSVPKCATFLSKSCNSETDQ